MYCTCIGVHALLLGVRRTFTERDRVNEMSYAYKPMKKSAGAFIRQSRTLTLGVQSERRDLNDAVSESASELEMATTEACAFVGRRCFRFSLPLARDSEAEVAAEALSVSLQPFTEFVSVFHALEAVSFVALHSFRNVT